MFNYTLQIWINIKDLCRKKQALSVLISFEHIVVCFFDTSDLT